MASSSSSCLSTQSLLLPRHTTLADPTTISSSPSSPHFISLPSRGLGMRKCDGEKRRRRSTVKVKAARYSDGVVAPWSIRDDLVVPSSPYFPAYAQGHGESEGFQSVMSQLFQYRIVCCGGVVDNDMANRLVVQLLHLDAMDPTRDIVMYINSPGGSVTAGMAIFDIMRHVRPDVATVCVGLAASMGAFLLAAGTKGKRYSLPNSRVMIHQPLGGASGQKTDIDTQVDEIMHYRAYLNGQLAKFTGQTLDQISIDTDIDYFMSPKEAQNYGLIDGIIMNPMKALPPLVATSSNESS